MKRNYSISRVLYAGFVLIGLVKIVTFNIGEGAIFMGVALAFDPFDAKMMWIDRPFWHKTWMITHLVLCSFFIGVDFFRVIRLD